MSPLEKEISGLVEDLKWGHPERRKKAAIKLGRIRDVGVIPHLINTLENDDYVFARVSALQSLLWIADKSAIASIIKIAETDPDLLVKKTAIEALGVLKIKNAIPNLERILNIENDIELRELTNQAINRINGTKSD
ncbi:MAG: HEAT repeat domain-containing protein [Candidatus Kariarchaeaceae archaeon]|jgi:HEAT repeat protein